METIVYSALLEDILSVRDLNKNKIMNEIRKKGFKLDDDVKEYIKFSLNMNPNLHNIEGRYHFNGNFIASIHFIKEIESRLEDYPDNVKKLYEDLKIKLDKKGLLYEDKLVY